MSNQNQDTVLELARNFKRYEDKLAYYTGASAPDTDTTIDDRDLDLPVPFRLAEIQTDKDALKQFVEKNLAKYHKYSSRLEAHPHVGLHAFYTSRHCFAVRYAQRVLGLPAQQLLAWPELLQRLFAHVHHALLQQLFKDEMTLTPSTSLVQTRVHGKPSTHYHNDGNNAQKSDPITVTPSAANQFSANNPITMTPIDSLDRSDKFGSIISPKVTPPLRKRQYENAAQQNSFDSKKMRADYNFPVTAKGNQSRLGSASKLNPQVESPLKDILTPIVGDKPYANFNDYINIVLRKNIEPFESIDEGSRENSGQDEEAISSDELIIEALKFAKHRSTFFKGSEPETSPTKPPTTEEVFSRWYYRLGDYEQCYVQTAAALSGISAHEISLQADMLYQSIHDGAEKRESSIRIVSHQGDQQETQYTETFRFDDLLIQRIPGTELYSSIYAITRKEMGEKRLYWQDVDQDGLSIFGLNLLAFLTHELINRGDQGQKFLNVLFNWSQCNEKKELSLKAAHAYGVVLWCYDENLLWTRANEWAQVKSHLNWQRTAELLNGAHEIECIKGDENSSVVLRLLDSWIAQVHQYLNDYQQFRMQENKTPSTDAQAQKVKVNLTLVTNLAWTVAYTYELIGKRWPEIALPGLQRLLQFSQIESTYYTRNIYAAVVSTYVNLARPRCIRDVLGYLAKNAECLSNWCQGPLKTDERLKYRLHRQISLNAILEAFFIIAAESYLGRLEVPSAFYRLTPSLSYQTSIHDSDEKEVLLEGLLSKMEVELREHITVLLCATIMEKKSRLAFSLLRKWAELVLETSGKQELNQFIVNLGETLEIWCRSLEKMGFRAPPAIEAYTSRVKQWNEEGHFLHIP